MTGSALDVAREVRDCHGRRYRVGEHARELLGRPRSSVLWLAALPMAAVGLLQYAYGAAVPTLMARHGWGVAEVFWLLAVWAVFQAGVGFPTAYLRERGRLGPRTVMVAGAVLSAIGLASLAHAPNLAGALVGYSVLGGTGAGLVYAACTSTVTKWYPERMARRVSVVTGAFAYGTVPFAVAAVVVLAPANLAPALDGTAAAVLVVVAACGLLFRDPPARWWPPHVDPRERSLAPGRWDVPASREYSTQQALHTRVLAAMYLVLLGAGAVSLFNAAFLVVFALGSGIPVGAVAVAAGLLVGLSGAGRSLAIRVAERFGRRQTLAAALLVQALAQLLLAATAASGSTTLLALGAALAGVGGGAFYPLFAWLVRDFFGEQEALEVHSLVYSAKAFGGLVGVGLAALAVTGWGFVDTFLIAGGVALASAIGAGGLARPGLPVTLPTVRAARRSAAV